MPVEFDLPAVLTELLYGDETKEPIEQTFDRLLTPNYVQRINGSVYRLPEFAAHVREMRQMVVGGGEVRVLEEVKTDSAIAGRYLFRMVSADGQDLNFESHLFAKITGGKVERLVEVARQVEADDDGDLLNDR
jgi:hypothetical protein